MIVYTTNTFISSFEKDFKKHHISVEDFCKKLKITVPIHIKEPLYKVKFFVN
jgi:hypothetical protein